MSGEFAGTLREHVVLERRDGARDALGGAAGAWAPIGSAWAAIMPDGRPIAPMGEAIDGRGRWLLGVRARDVRAGDRILWGETRLMVRGVRRDPRSPGRMLIMAEEGR